MKKKSHQRRKLEEGKGIVQKNKVKERVRERGKVRIKVKLLSLLLKGDKGRA